MTLAWLSAHLRPLDCQQLTYLLFCAPESWNSLCPPELRGKTNNKKSAKAGIHPDCWLHYVADTDIAPPHRHNQGHFHGCSESLNFNSRLSLYTYICT